MGPVPDIIRDPGGSWKLRKEICAWLRANDIDPADVPADAPLSFDPSTGVLTYRAVVRRSGVLLTDPFGNSPVTREMHAPIGNGQPPWMT